MNRDEDMKPATITVKSRRRVATNSKFDIFLDHVIDSGGHEVVDYLAVEPKLCDSDHVTGACILPILEDKFGLVRFVRYPLGRVSWEAPKGFIEPAESREQGALRELMEETGLSCSLSNIRLLGFVAPDPGVIKGRVALFAALSCTGDPRPGADDLGLGGVHFFDHDAVARLISDGSIEDAATIVAYHRYLAGNPSPH
jgi:8-oxo-dGTP pyrophosphatase MutT (NUDIX family)